jgi:hypothetical protein
VFHYRGLSKSFISTMAKRETELNPPYGKYWTPEKGPKSKMAAIGGSIRNSAHNPSKWVEAVVVAITKGKFYTEWPPEMPVTIFLGGF